jgi:GNAT superfamily N-acetyltransferase
MAKAANYSIIESLSDGRLVEIRALRPQDRADFVAAVERSSAESLYTRFFAPRRSFSEDEVAFFLNVDFVTHVALVAVVDEGGRPVIVAGGRYHVLSAGTAEAAFTVIDQYQGRGVGKLLMRHLAAIAREAGLKQLVADVLSSNVAMLKVFANSGLRLTTTREAGIVHVALELR